MNVINRRIVGAWLIAVGKGVGGFNVRLGRSVLSSPELCIQYKKVGESGPDKTELRTFRWEVLI